MMLALDSLERVPGLVGVQPPSGVLGEQTFDDRAQRVGAQERCRPVEENSGEGSEQRASFEGQSALDRCEQCRAEREQVRGRPGITTGQPLWRDVCRGTEKPTGRRGGILNGARDAEVSEDHPPASAQVHVARLDVAVHDARPVRCLEHVD
jgi:hypothetical protein